MGKTRQRAIQGVRPTQNPPQRVVLGYVHPGGVSAYFVQSLVGTLLYDRATSQHVAGILNEWSSANISNARNRIVRDFLAGEGDWLLFIDADMAWEANAVSSLLAVADAQRVPIVGGLCFGSNDGRLFPTIYVMSKLEDGSPMTMRLKDFPEDTLLRCAATGAAFLMIHRTALETIRDKAFNEVFPWFQETQMSGEPVSEDLTFCLRAGVCGLPVHVNTAVKIGHHKSTVLTDVMFREQQPEEVTADVGS